MDKVISSIEFAILATVVWMLIAVFSIAYVQADPLCFPVAAVKADVLKGHGTWVTLTSDQWQFMRGIYAMHPTTPLDVPVGDSAVISKFPEDAGSLVFFIDGEQACAPIAAPPELVALLVRVGNGDVTHVPTNGL